MILGEGWLYNVSMRKSDAREKLSRALWQIYRRPERPLPWTNGGNLPWNEPAFAERMLREHLDESHGAATRQTRERTMQIDWLVDNLKLLPEQHLFDVTCGPGLYAVPLAEKGLQVTGLDFSPASIRYARELAARHGMAARCIFVEQDVREYTAVSPIFDAAILLYGQLAVMPPADAQQVLTQIARSLKPGGQLCLELLNPAHVDRTHSNWWFTDESGLWGDAPFLHLGERFWLADENCSVERYQIVHLESGEMDEIILADQVYEPTEVVQMLERAGFTAVAVHPAWDQLRLYDVDEWIVYTAQRSIEVA